MTSVRAAQQEAAGRPSGMLPEETMVNRERELGQAPAGLAHEDTAAGGRRAGGDPACWAHLVCAECGAIMSEGHRPECITVREPPGTG
jgi:hypothetical protein